MALGRRDAAPLWAEGRGQRRAKKGWTAAAAEGQGQESNNGRTRPQSGTLLCYQSRDDPGSSDW